MKTCLKMLATLWVGLLLLSGCDRAADAQKREEAINRGEAPAATDVGRCSLVQGKWLDDARACKLTPKACVATGGTWTDDGGCSVATAEPDGCDTAGGVAAESARCKMVSFPAADIEAAWTCHAAQGRWLADTHRCGVTAHLCAQASGSWQSEAGCEIPQTDAATECKGLSGLRIVNDRCLLMDLSAQQVEELGAEDVERARSKLKH